MNSRPLIGVTTSEVRIAERNDPTPHGDPAQHEMALGLKYMRAIEAAGGLPVVIPPMDQGAIEPLLDRLTGVCLSGGPDLDPSLYGAEAHPELGPVETELDRFELVLAAAADARRMPLLAICRGAQAFNVSRGGTLDQHLPDRGEALDHRQDEAGEVATHPVEVVAGSLLASLVGAGTLMVNSFHHQAVDRIGRSLEVVARAADGVVEAIEARDRDFAVGVQWHAECLAGRSDGAALFGGLVDAAQRSEAGGLRRAA
ncbi:MAG: gamma-glutamyl-gamma-aminobutyrate hydrolase family protein [Thermoleophilaceae bacterium]|nr:gamma-glutamyl-gamma-aminobutyrate hydrolase family protein [Thermoleophilaceae bacterium]